MPEGDSIFNAAEKLRPFVVGETIVELREHGLLRRDFAGRVVTRVRARGKHLLVEVEGAGTIHLHFRMSGRMWIDESLPAADRSEPAERKRQLASLAIVVERGTVLFTRTPVVEILRAQLVHAHPALARLGPDLLACDDDAIADIVRRARAPEVTDRAIGEVLLSQRVAAGIGNVYKSEVLFLERVDPFVPARDLDDDVLARLYRRAKELLAANVGPHRPRRRVTTANMARGERPARGQGRFFVYRRVGRPCFECGEFIQSRVTSEAGRVTYFCPRCQAGADARQRREPERENAASAAPRPAGPLKVRELLFGDD